MEFMSGYVQLCLESEISWSNLMEDSMEMESIALMKEDASLADKAESTTKEKIVAWLKDKWEKIKRFFKNLQINIANRLRTIDIFLNTHKKELDSISDMKITINTVDWVNSNNVVKEITRIAKDMTLKILKDIPTNGIYQGTNDKNYKLTATFIRDNVILDDKVQPIDFTVGECVNELKGAQGCLTMLNDFRTSTDKIYTSALRILTVVNKIEKKEETAKIIAVTKKLVNLCDNICVDAFNVSLRFVGDCLRVVKQGLQTSRQAKKS